MALTQSVIDGLVIRARSNLVRALILYDRFAVDGGTIKPSGDFGPLLQPDRRDAAQFIFFEAAALFETFCCEAFKIEVRKRFQVSPTRSEYIMGSIDNGLRGIMGWASPTQLQSRGRALNGVAGFFGRLEKNVGNATYQSLSQAHKVRNRIAHSGGKAIKDFNGVLAQLGVPQRARKGASVGRVLMDYPLTAPINNRNFHRFIAAYQILIDKFEIEVKA